MPTSRHSQGCGWIEEHLAPEQSSLPAAPSSRPTAGTAGHASAVQPEPPRMTKGRPARPRSSSRRAPCRFRQVGGLRQPGRQAGCGASARARTACPPAARRRPVPADRRLRRRRRGRRARGFATRRRSPRPISRDLRRSARNPPPGTPRVPLRGLATWPMNRISGEGILTGDVDASRGVGGAGAAGDEADARPAGKPAFAVGHHRGAAFLPAHDRVDRQIMESVEDRQIGFAGHAKDALDAICPRARRRSAVRRSSFGCFSSSARISAGVFAEPRRGALIDQRRPDMSIGARTEGNGCHGRRRGRAACARDRLRVGEHLADRVDRAGRHAGRLQLGQQRHRVEAC